MKNKRQWSSVRPLRNTRFRPVLLTAFFALFAPLLFTACPMEDDPDTGAGIGLDPRLVGTWRWELDGYEEIIIRSDGILGGADDVFILGGNYSDSGAYVESFAGTIHYAERFSSSAGIIIIEYLPERENSWPYWGGKPEPPGDFYGIYYLNMNSAGTEVFLALTNDQANNNGPTETKTLDAAIAKFTQGNMSQLLDLEVGDPQHKVDG